jgi:FtsP/CotA-like multicopper oxidase with cupredoxin domain
MRRLGSIACIMLLAVFGCGEEEETVAGAGGGPPAVVPLPDVEGIAPASDDNPDPAVLEVQLIARPSSLQLVPGPATELLTYNDQLPGPLLHARVGDRVIVHFDNQLAEPTTVHWHGLRISDQMDGSPLIQSPIQPGETFTYDFVVPEAGTFWYHTHLHQIEQFERGLYGAIVVHEAEPPQFSRERVFMADDVRLTADNAIAPFLTSGPDIGRGRVGNTLLVNGLPIPHQVEIARGAIERWRFILATNALSHGLRVQGADVRVIATDGGLLPQAFPLDRVDVAPGQRYELEVRPQAGAAEVVLEALILVLDENEQIVEEPFPLVRATVVGETTAAEPVYPLVEHPRLDVAAETLEWALAGSLVDGAPVFTIDGVSTFVGEGHEHVLLHTFVPDQPVKIRFTSNVSPEHPFHIHGQFFQILERNGQPVFEPGLRDTVKVRLQEDVTILSYFENPGRWMVHCHISEHSENGMMADIQVGPATGQHNHP